MPDGEAIDESSTEEGSDSMICSINARIEASSTSAVGPGSPPEEERMNVDAQAPMAYGLIPPRNEVYDQGFHVPAPTAARARLTDGRSQTRPNRLEPDDHRPSAGKLWGATPLAMPSEPCASRRRSDMKGKATNGGCKTVKLVA